MSTTFVHHTDPAHGWIEVSLGQIIAAGLMPSDFSEYSYRTKTKFYLEEDCDASKFVDAWRAKIGPCEFTEKYSHNSFIRRLSRMVRA